MGSRIRYVTDDALRLCGQGKRPKNHVGTCYTGEIVCASRESPKEAFSLLFPRYHISQYCGHRLQVFWEPINFFGNDKFRSLQIDEIGDSKGSLSSLYKTRISGALRSKAKRSDEYLAREADIILHKVLPLARHSVQAGGSNVAQFDRCVHDLEDVFRNELHLL